MTATTGPAPTVTMYSPVGGYCSSGSSTQGHR
jgi:hypothetical protein